jgi:hypothetical protein
MAQVRMGDCVESVTSDVSREEPTKNSREARRARADPGSTITVGKGVDTHA